MTCREIFKPQNLTKKLRGSRVKIANPADTMHTWREWMSKIYVVIYSWN